MGKSGRFYSIAFFLMTLSLSFRACLADGDGCTCFQAGLFKTCCARMSGELKTSLGKNQAHWPPEKMNVTKVTENGNIYLANYPNIPVINCPQLVKYLPSTLSLILSFDVQDPVCFSVF